MQMQMWMFKRCGTSNTFDVGYRVLKDLILHRSSINNSSSLSNKFGRLYFSVKFGISSLLHHVVTALVNRIRELLEYIDVHDNDTSESSKPSWGKIVNFAKKESMKKAFQDILHGLGEVNPTHAYYTGSKSKDNEDPSWSTSLKTRITQKTSSALEDIIFDVIVLVRNIVQGIENKAKTVTFEQEANLSTHTPEPSRRFNSICYDDDDDEESTIPLNAIISQLPPSIAITTSLPVLPTMEPEDSLIMGDKDLHVIPEKESDEVIKSSVEDLVPIPSEFDDTSDNDSECDLPFCDDSPPLDILGGNSMTFSNSLFDFNDDFTSCKDNPLFDEEFEDISSLDPPKLTPVIDEPTLLDTLPLPCTDVLGDVIVDIDLPLGEHLDTLSTGDREIDFDPIRDIEELDRLLADGPVPVPRVFNEPLGNSDLISRSFDFGPLKATPLLDESILLVTPLPDVSLREVERFDPFFSLTQSGNMTRVMETHSSGFHHMPSPRPAAYSPKEVMYCYFHPHLTSGDGFDHGPKMK
ncbi:hypothetical protein Tco_0024830 [Tanacetum coccineum]